jgi:signal transduction histidine kinase
VVKHADRAPTRVTVGPAPGALQVTVIDAGSPRATPTAPAMPTATRDGPASGGRGLAGIRERAALFGGTVTVGPEPAGGFRVSACLPLGGSTAGAPR